MLKSELIESLAQIDFKISSMYEDYIGNSYSDFILKNGCLTCDGRGIQKMGNSFAYSNNIYFACVDCDGKSPQHSLSFYVSNIGAKKLVIDSEWEYAAKQLNKTIILHPNDSYIKERRELLSEREILAFKLYHKIYDLPLCDIFPGDVVAYNNEPYTVLSVGDFSEEILGGFNLVLKKQNGKHIRSSIANISIAEVKPISKISDKLPKLSGVSAARIKEAAIYRNRLISLGLAPSNVLFNNTDCEYWISFGKKAT